MYVPLKTVASPREVLSERERRYRLDCLYASDLNTFGEKAIVVRRYIYHGAPQGFQGSHFPPSGMRLESVLALTDITANGYSRKL